MGFNLGLCDDMQMRRMWPLDLQAIGSDEQLYE